ncbi:MAG: phosphocholine cytidylyltransferase family protein, partial [Rhodospirillaceae bacterium]|nr:phosphocholine cytidylyltransferase family protein [Rhodospirillaceae bacterium]
KAIILSAGKGSRLGALTANSPKCLLKLGPRSLLGWQVHMLKAGGVSSVCVVTGFETAQVEAEVKALSQPDLVMRTLLNPFYHIADNLSTCWMARGEMQDDFILLNGDTLIDAEIVRRLIAAPPAPITLTVDHKASYDDDDMKVQEVDGRVLNVSKKLDPSIVSAESIGMIRFRADGAAAFVAELEAAIRTDTGLQAFYLASIAKLAQRLHVTTAGIDGLKWCEVDFPKDYEAALKLTAAWAAR